MSQRATRSRKQTQRPAKADDVKSKENANNVRSSSGGSDVNSAKNHDTDCTPEHLSVLSAFAVPTPASNDWVNNFPTPLLKKKRTSSPAAQRSKNTQAGKRRCAAKRQSTGKSTQSADEHAAYVLRMRAHFDEVDEFEMAVETVSAAERTKLAEIAHKAAIATALEQAALVDAQRKNAEKQQSTLEASPATVSLTPEKKKTRSAADKAQKFELRRGDAAKTRRERLQQRYAVIEEKGIDALEQELSYVTGAP